MSDEPLSFGTDDIEEIVRYARTADSAAEQDAASGEGRETEDTENLDAAPSPNESELAGLTAFELAELTGGPISAEQASLDLLRDVELDLRVELGRTQLPLEDVLKLNQGSVVALDKLAGDPVDIYANGKLVARGEVLVLDDNFCVRVADLIAGDAGD